MEKNRSSPGAGAQVRPGMAWKVENACMAMAAPVKAVMSRPDGFGTAYPAEPGVRVTNAVEYQIFANANDD